MDTKSETYCMPHTAHLGDAVDAAVVLPELAARDAVLPVAEEGKGEAAQPAHHLLPAAEVAVLQHLVVVHHAILQTLHASYKHIQMSMSVHLLPAPRVIHHAILQAMDAGI
jgi:hypothetical protein